MQPGQRLDHRLAVGHEPTVEPLQHHTRLHGERRRGRDRGIDVDLESTFSPEPIEALLDAAGREGERGLAGHVRGQGPAERDAEEVGPGLREVAEGAHQRAHLILERVGLGRGLREPSLQPLEGLANHGPVQGVFVLEVGVEGADPGARGAGDLVRVRPLEPALGEKRRAGLEQARASRLLGLLAAVARSANVFASAWSR